MKQDTEAGSDFMSVPRRKAAESAPCETQASKAKVRRSQRSANDRLELFLALVVLKKAILGWRTQTGIVSWRLSKSASKAEAFQIIENMSQDMMCLSLLRRYYILRLFEDCRGCDTPSFTGFVSVCGNGVLSRKRGNPLNNAENDLTTAMMKEIFPALQPGTQELQSLRESTFGQVISILERSQGEILRHFSAAAERVVDALMELPVECCPVFTVEEIAESRILECPKNSSGLLSLLGLRVQTQIIVWFLAPTVALSIQQKEVITSHLPAVNIKLLIGDDGVDRWSEQRNWDDTLRDLRIVVSTHAVLAEALVHRFVAMANLALIVFAEAHHCVKNHPVNRIIKDLYHPTKNEQGPESVPRILGLTASPIMRTKLHDMPQIERNLNAVCRTPREQRQDLMKYVHPPQLMLLRYAAPGNSSRAWSSPFLEAVSQAHSHAQLELLNHSIFREVQDQLENFHAKATGIGNLIGTWAGDCFIAESVKKLVGIAGMDDSLWADPAKARLSEILRPILQLAPAIPGSSSTASEKVCRLWLS
ncbi:hypothetical protein BBP40_009460 [Aspergillus hancockii]|nr:hypothetical protein BBP40_009460 [Aspergillus hancockii]